jgi:hypothetical protein
MYLRSLRAVALVVVSMAAFSCSSPEQSPPPRQVDSGFDFQDNAFAFPNYGGDTQVQLTPDMVARMCGVEVACVDGELPCTLNPVARNWMRSTNVTLEQGRSEGMAVAALMFATGQLDPNDFGAPTAAQLQLFGNRKLQKEIAYWSATQALPVATSNDVRYDAKSVFPFLVDALSPNRDKTYRLAIAQKTDTGFARGHALVPIGYYKGEGTTYLLRVYDSNFPQKERLLTIDPVANTWSYEVPTLDGETLVWEGTPENQNKLYFSPIEDRLGTLECPFAADSKVQTVAYAGMTMVQEGADGEQTGIVDGEVVESGGSKVVPAFSDCTRCGGSMQVINQASIAAGFQALSVTATSDVRTQQYDDMIAASGPDYAAHVRPRGNSNGDKVTFGDDASVDYESNTSQGVEITTAHKGDDGSYNEVTVTVDGGTDTSGVTVRVKRTPDGKQQVEVEGLPEGKEVTVTVLSREGTGAPEESHTVTYKSNGEDSSAVVDPATGDVTAQNADELSGGSCANGTRDGTETDVDCGGQCNRCDEGKTCATDTDCAGGTCATVGSDKICRSQQCSDGVKNGDETDVDCGGDVCVACTATNDNATTPTCNADSDCDTEMCVDGRCRIKNQVVARIDGLPRSGFYLYYYLDGRQTGKFLSATTATGTEPGWDAVVDLGEAYEFNVETMPAGCFTKQVFAPGVTGLDGADDTEPRGTIDLYCPTAGYRWALADVQYAEGLPALPADDPVKIKFWLDSYPGQTRPATVTIDASGQIGTSPVQVVRGAQFSDYWFARVVQVPSGTYTNPTTGQPDGIFCRMPPDKSSGTMNSLKFVASVRCDWASNGTCSDGVKNLDESDVDCGGSCPVCDVAEQCVSQGDCAEGVTCSEISGQRICVDYRRCYDFTLNNEETDVDCGGPYCDGCAEGEQCNADTDCEEEVCTNGVCAARTCSDGVQNGYELGVDCGGSYMQNGSGCTATCPLGNDCYRDIDCTSGWCEKGAGLLGQCAEALCTDGVQNGTESDVDCGGTSCNGCAIGETCTADSDCADQYCDANTDTCATPTCTDGIENGEESDVDCGGSSCNGCADGKACTADSDCTNQYCDATTDTCATPTCTDGVKNGDESDVDCGGSSCNACRGGKTCNADSDCITDTCNSGVCSGATCSDGIKNQDETGVDCGGSFCGACGLGEACTTDGDCTTDDCYCGASSGNCSGASGQCGAGKFVIDQPTTDGVQVSGTVTVPASCSQVYVQAWGAAGGPGSSSVTGPTAGGAGGYVSGTLPTAAGDTFSVWVGQGGATAGTFPAGTPGIGSKFGTAASGGAGDDAGGGGPGPGPGGDAGGDGGGLTSVQQSGSASVSFVVPAGAGASSSGAGQDVQAGAGGGSTDSNGEDAFFGSGSGGGGAGDQGGSIDQAGTYGTLSASLTSSDGSAGTPANTSAPDYSLCQGLNNGSPGAGSGAIVGALSQVGGDGCVILRCVSP